jgi:hypothetical protein
MQYSLHFSRLASLAVAAICFGTASSGFGQASAPAILTQPVSQNVDYGSDVSFSVGVSGSVASFQWQKNGENLIDFDNVAGSQTSTLNLVGVAANDIGNYTVVIGCPGSLSLTSSVATLGINATVIFSDGFENGAGSWQPLLDSTGLELTGVYNHTPGGSTSLQMSNSTQKVFHNLSVQYACRVKFSFWLYDDGQNQVSCGGELRGYTGPGYGKYSPPGGLTQIIAIGRLCAAANMMAGETLDTTLYQGCVLRGTNTGWFNLSAPRSAGWHHFLIDRAGSGTGGTVDFYVDGTLAGTITGASTSPVDSIFLGSLGGSRQSATVAGNAWFDDVEVDDYPGLFDWQSLASSGPILDWMKLRETGTNWQVVNATPVTAVEVAGSGTNGGLGDWNSDSPAIYATGMRGHLDYTVTTTSDDAYRVEVEGRERNYRMPVVDMPVEVWVDGAYMARLSLSYGAQTNGMLHCFTPFIRAGTMLSSSIGTMRIPAANYRCKRFACRRW